MKYLFIFIFFIVCSCALFKQEYSEDWQRIATRSYELNKNIFNDLKRCNRCLKAQRAKSDSLQQELDRAQGILPNMEWRELKSIDEYDREAKVFEVECLTKQIEEKANAGR